MFPSTKHKKHQKCSQDQRQDKLIKHNISLYQSKKEDKTLVYISRSTQKNYKIFGIKLVHKTTQNLE